MAQEHLNLLKLAATSPAQLGASSAQIMGRDSRNASGFRVWLDKLPDDFLRKDLARKAVGAIHRPEYASVHYAGRGCPRVNRNLYPVRHRRSSNTTMFADEVNDAPSTITLLDVRKLSAATSERRKLEEAKNTTIGTFRTERRWPTHWL